ncbi:helix-turn-helix domain-containing protein, partial [Pseudomonas sp. 2VD]|uniref:helix-turn-helix domain-containing protein n=1 Tax=Pseudomonas sp. 2VD TaxID=2502205 RepID=UPI0010F622F5
MKDLDDLAAFAVLHDLGSFTRAAERLGCSKGQLSKRIGLPHLADGEQGEQDVDHQT